MRAVSAETSDKDLGPCMGKMGRLNILGSGARMREKNEEREWKRIRLNMIMIYRNIKVN